ncbi:MAG: 30S ribosomal protein S15 [Parcubacteria group bacterium]|nr:30S ribosomal protein S15 [Parcubacteria group bacterium]
MKDKKKSIEKSRLHEKDTGSPEVQISILSEEITLLSNHCARNKKDITSKRALLNKVAQRRKLLRYLTGKRPERAQQITAEIKGK